jgi:hypothetical protein
MTLMIRLLLVGGGPIGVASAYIKRFSNHPNQAHPTQEINSYLMDKSAWAATSQVSHTRRLRDP